MNISRISTTILAMQTASHVPDLVDEILVSLHAARYVHALHQLEALEALLLVAPTTSVLNSDNVDEEDHIFDGDSEEKKLRAKLKLYNKEMLTIRNRAHKVLETIRLEESVGKSDSEWIYGTCNFGVTTYYKVDDDNCITVRMEGGSDDVPFFEQAATIHDIDNFKHWIPFCDESILLEEIGPAELLGKLCDAVCTYSCSCTYIYICFYIHVISYHTNLRLHSALQYICLSAYHLSSVGTPVYMPMRQIACSKVVRSY